MNDMFRIFSQRLFCLFLLVLGNIWRVERSFCDNEAPPCANGGTFCESVETYPQEHISDLLEGSKEFNSYFNARVRRPVIEGRRNDDDQFLCSSIPQRISPDIAESTSHIWKYVAQKKNEGYTQIFIADLCVPEKPACKYVNFPLGYTAACKQKYSPVRLLALDKSGKLAPDDFLFPSACLCSYKQN
ncbi:hypothetical protein WA026_005517 [Henosepilachna vigintioctopunctata]|uniref:Spaetzle domain-containing protein n=1 Tax=Henosepilachna vigintioctopunctata TaxID=420089 RepID=A0AAW1U345_9CUCU